MISINYILLKYLINIKFYYILEIKIPILLLELNKVILAYLKIPFIILKPIVYYLNKSL
jgi:hypothetical protein